MYRAVLMLSLTLILVACRPPDQGGAAVGRTPGDIEGRIVLPEVPAAGPAVITVELSGPAGPVTGATVTVTGDMTHAGMVPVISETFAAEPGVYETSGFTFSMGGDWFVLAEVELVDGRTFELAPVTTSVRSN